MTRLSTLWMLLMMVVAISTLAFLVSVHKGNVGVPQRNQLPLPRHHSRFLERMLTKSRTSPPPPPPLAVVGSGDDVAVVDSPAASALHRNLRTDAARDEPPRRKIAVAITVTKDGPYLDGAAVLAHSVRMTKSRHHIEMVAIVHPGVITTRPSLAKLGFRVIEFQQPILSSEIEGKHLRETIDKSGCCGTMELLKLRAYQLTQYHRVLLLDMDTVIVRNLDHLFDRVSGPHTSLAFTYDHAMDNAGSRAPPVQGGFLLVTPSEERYKTLIDIVRKGDFRPGTGWGGTKIGWCWGGQTVQGLLAYYYTLVAPSKDSVALNPCTYNSMVTTENCSTTPFDTIQSIHFTQCQKPWEASLCAPPRCAGPALSVLTLALVHPQCHRGHKLCGKMHSFWWSVRQDLQRTNNLTPDPQCCGGCESRHYHKLSIERIAGSAHFD